MGKLRYAVMSGFATLEATRGNSLPALDGVKLITSAKADS